jgi:uncharacterized DUF497 family protein
MFDDPFKYRVSDKKHSSKQELRYKIIGLTGLGYLAVVITPRRIENEGITRTRIISARKANWEEIDEYNRRKWG